jgi:uncharacterized protein (TIGR02466 family)
MRLVELFATPVVIKEFDRKFNVEELIFIDDILKDTYKNRGNSTSRETFVFQRDELADIHQFCIDSVNEYVAEVMRHINCKLRITQSWVNVSTAGEFHHMHNHPNSMVSGVLYIETGDEDIIQFYRTRETTSFLHESDGYNQYNSTSWYFPVKTGELILFPSHLFHDVPRVKSSRRISLSFNTFPEGQFGSIDMLSFVD